MRIAYEIVSLIFHKLIWLGCYAEAFRNILKEFNLKNWSSNFSKDDGCTRKPRAKAQQVLVGCFAKIMMTRYHCIKLILWVYLTISPVIKLILTNEGKLWVYLDNQRIVVTIYSGATQATLDWYSEVMSLYTRRDSNNLLYNW